MILITRNPRKGPLIVGTLPSPAPRSYVVDHLATEGFEAVSPQLFDEAFCAGIQKAIGAMVKSPYKGVMQVLYGALVKGLI